MADSTKIINPWVLHLQKLALELKCPLCLRLLKRPSLLPCDHIFCGLCLPGPSQFGHECPVCKNHYNDEDARPLYFIENLVTIYRGLDAAFSANLSQSVPGSASMAVKGQSSRSVDYCEKSNKQLGSCSLNENFTCAMSAQLSNELGHSSPFTHSIKIQAPKAGMAEKWNPKETGDDQNAAVGRIDDGHNSQQNCNFTLPSSLRGFRSILQCQSLQTDNNQVDQFSPGSPPSFGDNKGSQNDSNDQAGDDSPQNYLGEKLGKRTSDDVITHERQSSSASETEEDHLRGFKKHKMQNYVPLDEHANNDHAGPIACQKTESVMTHTGLPSETLDDSSTAQNVCAFCQSSKVSKDSGPMLHYVNGKLVKGNEAATLPNVIHVHNTCIEWAPQVYYEVETVKNLNEELARGAKLKCAKCGLKGAALGCYLTSCRKSYHVTCAMEIKKCRWDYDDYLMLCPSHSSVKFPREKSKSSKKDLKRCLIPSQMVPQQPNFWSSSSNGVKEWVLCGSALSSEEKVLLVKFGAMIGVPVTKFWKPNVTHVIAAKDTNGVCTRTLKVLMAILNGKWVLSIDWIKACMESKQPVDEGPFEINLDNHGSQDGPKTGRLRVLDNAPKLFNGLKFYFSGDFQPGYKEDLQNLVVNAGGTILHGEEAIAGANNDLSAALSVLIVYNLDLPKGCKLGEEVTTIWQRLNEAQDLAVKTGSQVIGHTWLLESIAVYKLQPIVS